MFVPVCLFKVFISLSCQALISCFSTQLITWQFITLHVHVYKLGTGMWILVHQHCLFSISPNPIERSGRDFYRNPDYYGMVTTGYLKGECFYELDYPYTSTKLPSAALKPFVKVNKCFLFREHPDHEDSGGLWEFQVQRYVTFTPLLYPVFSVLQVFPF